VTLLRESLARRDVSKTDKYLLIVAIHDGPMKVLTSWKPCPCKLPTMTVWIYVNNRKQVVTSARAANLYGLDFLPAW
jgi:hypothetical protein